MSTKINKKTRESNFELLRMLAMFLVLLVHADFFSIGRPNLQDILTETLDSTLRIFFEALSIVCVNVFVLISGWFGIRPSLKGISSFVFQCLFFLIGLYSVSLAIGTSTLSLEGIANCFAATRFEWFIKAYLFLYILSPVLNAFVEHADRVVFRNVIIGSFVFTCTYGWIGAAAFMVKGYTTLFFIQLYLLARYMKIYKPRLTKFHSFTDFLIYIAVACLVTALCVTPPLVVGYDFQPYWNYISPTTVIGAVYLLLAFSKLKLQSRFVNWCGTSCFAVYLVHMNPNTINFYKTIFVYLHTTLSTFEFWGVTFVVLTTIFFVAILIDQLRIVLWNKVWLLIERNK